LHTEGGVLAASMAQELLIRPNPGGPVERSEGRWLPEETQK
jgi:hypothetical protein